MKKYKYISLFTGAMGLDIGIEKAGNFELLACVEKEQIFCNTIRENISFGNIKSNPKVYEIDIKKLDPYKVMDELGLKEGELDLLVGGPPCQSFSTAGRRGTIQDTKGTLLWDFLRFVKAIKPKVFIMENVRGLLSAAIRHRPIALRPERGGALLEEDELPGSVIKQFTSDLKLIEDAPYHVDCFEVNSVNYGAPQIRERVLFIGNRYNLEISIPNPTHGNPSECENLGLLPWKTLGDALAGLKEDKPIIIDFSPRKKKYLQMIPPGGNWRCLSESAQKESMGNAYYAKGGRSGWWRRLSMDLPCPTLVTLPNHASTALCHPIEVRALSLKEYIRIQEFPDDWIVCGKPTEQYTQIGNAVPTKLGEIAGYEIIKALEIIESENLSPNNSQSQIRPYRIIYIQSHVRTRQWFKDGKAIRWVDGEENHEATYKLPTTLRTSKLIDMGSSSYG